MASSNMIPRGRNLIEKPGTAPSAVGVCIRSVSPCNFGADNARMHFGCAARLEKTCSRSRFTVAPGLCPASDTSAEQEKAYADGLDAALDAGYSVLEARRLESRCRHRRGVCPGGQSAVQRRTRRGAQRAMARRSWTRRSWTARRSSAGAVTGLKHVKKPDCARAAGHGPLASRDAGRRRRGRVRAAAGCRAGVQRILPHARAPAAAAPAARRRLGEGKRSRGVRHRGRGRARRAGQSWPPPRRRAA